MTTQHERFRDQQIRRAEEVARRVHARWAYARMYDRHSPLLTSASVALGNRDLDLVEVLLDVMDEQPDPDARTLADHAVVGVGRPVHRQTPAGD